MCTALDLAIGEILRQDSPYAHSTITTIERWLRQFHLHGRVEACDILHEAYLRGQKIDSIQKPYAWLKATAFNIVRERSRQFRKQQPTNPEVFDFAPQIVEQQEQPKQEIVDSCLHSLWNAFKILEQRNPEAAKLLHWQIIEGLSWREIHDRLVLEGEEAPSEAALRQRGSRAKKCLRKIYHSIDLLQK